MRFVPPALQIPQNPLVSGPLVLEFIKHKVTQSKTDRKTGNQRARWMTQRWHIGSWELSWDPGVFYPSPRFAPGDNIKVVFQSMRVPYELGRTRRGLDSPGREQKGGRYRLRDWIVYLWAIAGTTAGQLRVDRYWFNSPIVPAYSNPILLELPRVHHSAYVFLIHTSPYSLGNKVIDY